MENTEAFIDRIEGISDESIQHSWEAPMERTWESVAEDEISGSLLIGHVNKENQRRRRDALKAALDRSGAKGSVERGMIRYLYVILDLSGVMDAKDLKPSRKLCACAALEAFIRDYFDQNPISQMGLIVGKNRHAYRITELSGDPMNQIQLLQKEAENTSDGGGEFSLQNCLIVASSVLRQVPDYGSREILLVVGSLSTCDPGNVFETIDEMKSHRIRCSVVSLAAEVYIYKTLALKTKGLSDVLLHPNQTNLQELLFQHVSPPILDAEYNRSRTRSWVFMGFPKLFSATYPSLCSCHSDWTYKGILCPKCGSKYCELPTTCKICGLMLISSAHLARSYHHLFPIQFFVESDPATLKENPRCFSCRNSLNASEEIILNCPKCSQIFCSECDHYIHHTLYNCPGCLFY
jgi:transcription initiation factor TFIIH subunit 2